MQLLDAKKRRRLESVCTNSVESGLRLAIDRGAESDIEKMRVIEIGRLTTERKVVLQKESI